jgi:hypothetical protein
MLIREYLSEKHESLRMFSDGQLIGESVNEDDFRREFGLIKKGDCCISNCELFRRAKKS